MRRSFRIGLRLGLLVGIVAAALKMAQSRRSRREDWPPPAPPSWPPVQEASVTPEPPAATLTDAGSVVTRSAPVEPARPRPEPPVPAAPGLPESLATEPVGLEPQPPETEPAAPGPEPLETEPVGPGSEPLATERLWVEPEDGVCPASHPVKAKLASGLFHLPGMAAYNRTRPDRCYADEASATEDGLTRAKR